MVQHASCSIAGVLREILTTPVAKRSERDTARRVAGSRASRKTLLIVVGLACVPGRAVTAQSVAPPPPAGPPQPVFSIGQPSRWPQHVAALLPVSGDSDRGAARLSYGVHHAFMNPVLGVLGATAEGYAALGGRAAGVRLLAQSKVFGLSAGLDWNAWLNEGSPFLSFETAVRRGGLFGRGTMVRVDWLPARSHMVAIGLSMPVFEPLAGRTRPRRTHVTLPSVHGVPRVATPANAAVEAQRLGEAADALGAFSNAYSARAEHAIERYDGGYARAVAAYDGAIRRIFVNALGDTALASKVAAQGREVLLGSVLLPIDSLFGRARSEPKDLRPLTGAAMLAMEHWLGDTLRLAKPGRDAALGAFELRLSAVDRVHQKLLAEADDSRFEWLPLELALTADQFDEQSEVDSLIARAVGHPFTDRNALSYLRSTDLPLEIARSILAARSYHVLWTHDFTTIRPSGAVDNVGYRMVADAYLPALTAAAKRYDSTGVFPTYIVLQDEYWYEVNDNRVWMNILEDPLHTSMRLPEDSGGRVTHLLDRQRELRAAVAASKRLQRDAAASGDADRWLSRIVRVNVNIVEPRDFSFRSSHIVPGIPFIPDNIMRDHRKIVFYDLTEGDPYRGEELIMGVGIGEHYASATWEDRGYRLRGPATLEVRRAARETMLRNGFSEQDIPPPLRAVEAGSATAMEHRMNEGDYVGRALQVHNRVGFGAKQSSVARAMLYNLAPPGSVIIVPDPIWLSNTWAGMLVGAAARGCHVYVIAPSSANAPSPEPPLLGVEHDVFTRFLELRRSLGGTIRSAGGDFRVGIFNARAWDDDAAGRAREVREGLERAPWIRDVIPFDTRTLAVLNRAAADAANGHDGTELAHDERPRAPQLHQKSQLIARPGAIAALVRQSGWDAVLARSIDAQSDEASKFADQLRATKPDVDTTATRSTDALIRSYEQSLPQSERRRISFYFSLGTQNEDPRGLASDGEASLIVSGVQGSAGLVDLFYLMARSTWIDTEQQLTQLVPLRSWLMRVIGHRMRAAF